MVDLLPTPLSYGPKSGIFKPRAPSLSAQCPLEYPSTPIRLEETMLMQYEPQTEELDIEEARRGLGNVFAPWVQDLGLSIGSIECAAPPGATAEWQPGAILRMAFSERLCRHGGIVCGQALMAPPDTSMGFAILAANPRYRPIPTLDQTTQFMRAGTQSGGRAETR